ncbi:flavin reductase family protein [Rhodococcus fascians]|nr:flavin reductase family protein [Rhodococcus fascians]MBY3999948.1 flavin reductase family protein [Rhodococcus fascians]MBY4005131.1 flavin reductase family protein [Rhodococcus fascians]MBY4010310.1 flavin reductase family protein [Rhodococcus fascians]MBY4020353.1 flavin reductase family protein [Rhodococcus fascians]
MVVDQVMVGLQQSFREVMSNVCTPVSVVTTIVDGRPHGTTVSAFASLSMSPPMVLVALDEHSNLLSAVQGTRGFGVNILASEQAELASRFATKGQDKFDGVAWTENEGLPRLDDGHGWLACEVVELITGGDHVVVIGTVSVAETTQLSPLTYYQRGFGTHQVLGGQS